MNNIFKKTFDTITFIRQLTLNILFIAFAIFALIIIHGLFFSKTPPIIVEDNTTLSIDLNANIVEQYTTNAFSRSIDALSGQMPVKEIRLFDLLKSIEMAKDDNNIDKIYINTSGLSAGFAQVSELSNALFEAKKAGKEIIVFGENMDQKQYLIASVADKIYLDPDGSVLLEGISGYRQYYKEALQDKLNIDIHLFKVGEFKSAAEPYVLDKASEESKIADLYWMNGVWENYLAQLSKYRNISIENIKNIINNMPKLVTKYKGDMALLALENNLVDELLIEEKVFESSKKEIDFISYINSKTDLKNEIAIVVAQGEIVEGIGDLTQIGGDNTSEALRYLRNDPKTKAVVLRVDSPGGAVFASEQIRREVELIQKAGKPVVVSMGNIAASGGYWISMNADSIIANPTTITGSIGIFGLIPNFSRALDKIGIHTDGVATTEIAGALDITKPMNEEMSSMLQQIINNGYEKFINKVAIARDMKTNEVDSHARGRVWSGIQAKERGLVDGLGGLTFAIEKAKELAYLDENSKAFLVDDINTPFDNFILKLQGNSVSRKYFNALGFNNRLKYYLPENTMHDIDFLIKASKSNSSNVQIFAHCLCSI